MDRGGRRLKRWLLPALAPLAAAAAGSITPFSAERPGAAPPAPWTVVTLPGTKPNELALVEDGGATVLRIRAAQAAGSLTHKLAADPNRTPTLSWRWKVDRVVGKADLNRKEGDDYAARLYVFFDVREESLPLADRARLGLARLLYGPEVPAAAICYVWDNRHDVGTSAWNRYTSRVRMIVVQSGEERAGQWTRHSRDVAADFRAAFGGEPPTISGVAVSSDTDQTGEAVTAWFGDLRLEARPEAGERAR